MTSIIFAAFLSCAIERRFQAVNPKSNIAPQRMHARMHAHQHSQAAAWALVGAVCSGVGLTHSYARVHIFVCPHARMYRWLRMYRYDVDLLKMDGTISPHFALLSSEMLPVTCLLLPNPSL